MKRLLTSLLFAAILFSSQAFADDICSDRPGKASAPCTVPTGVIQVESDGINTTISDQDGIKNITNIVLDPTIKYGLSSNQDIELTITPYVDGKNGNQHFSGLGDTILKSKYEYQNTGNLNLAISPFIKIPTAGKNIGNGAWEGGVQFPIGYKINDLWSVESTPEIDVLKDLNDNGRHIATQTAFDVVRSLPYDISFTTEFWANYDYDRKITKQYSLDFSIGWVVRSDIQFDAGINFGLNKTTPRAQFFVGISKKF